MRQAYGSIPPDLAVCHKVAVPKGPCRNSARVFGCFSIPNWNRPRMYVRGDETGRMVSQAGLLKWVEEPSRLGLPGQGSSKGLACWLGLPLQPISPGWARRPYPFLRVVTCLELDPCSGFHMLLFSAARRERAGVVVLFGTRLPRPPRVP